MQLRFVGMTGIGAGGGGLIGTTFDMGFNGKAVEEVEERCSAYYTEEELEKFLNSHQCF